MSSKWESGLKIVGVVIGAIGLLFGSGILVRWWENRETTPVFIYTYEGAFDQSKPEYEVAFPLGWDDKQISRAKILVRADYSGKKYAGIAYIKVQQADGTIVTVGQWDDFSTDSEKQQKVPLSFSQLFQYSGLSSNLANLDVSVETPTPVSGVFKVYVESAGHVIPDSEQTVTVYNTPWFHRTYLDTYEVAPGDKIKAYVEIKNFGAESDFSVVTCPYRIATTSYQLDPTKTVLGPGIGWWPELSGNLQRVSSDLQQKPIRLGHDGTITVQIEFPDNATSDPGVYDFIVYVAKKLEVLDYGGSDWAPNDRSRDGRQHSTYVVIGR
jgi:hypothetical protein